MNRVDCIRYTNRLIDSDIINSMYIICHCDG